MDFFEFVDSNNEFSFGAVLMLAVMVIAIASSSCSKHNTRLYVQNGYHEVQKQGTTETMWVKKDATNAQPHP